jgi:hypothetical protein
MIINPQLPGGFVIFCDDIRHEVSGKETIVGKYSNELTVFGVSPVVLPKICMLICLRVDPHSRPCEGQVRITRSDTETPLASFDFDFPSPEEFPIRLTDETESESKIYDEAVVTATIGNLAVEKAFRLKVRAFIGEDEVRLGSLRIGFADPDSVQAV